MYISSFDNNWDKLRALGLLLGTAFLILLSHSRAQAAAPARAKPYAESICSTNPNVFFCEDFEGEDIINYGSNNCNSTWGNPAIKQKDICWAGGGSYQYDTASLPGFSATNRVWRISKTTEFTDIVTGINTGTGPGTIAGWLNPAILGTGAQEWWARVQVWFSNDTTFPSTYDFKMFYALPGVFVDPPSAAYETGLAFSHDVWCGPSYFPPSGQNFVDVPTVRYNSNFARIPYQNEFCPPLSPGVPADGAHSVRLQKSRWYTLEYHVKLSATSNGIVEEWVDGNKMFTATRVTCDNGCGDLGYVMILGWMNGADVQTGSYEIDNVVMSRSYIGPPTGSVVSPLAPPLAPANLSVAP